MAEEVVLRNLDPIEIQKYQQNRYPCFFVDCIEEAVPGKYAKGYKKYTSNEWFFQNSQDMCVPESVQIETLTQVFLMTFLTMPENKGEKTSFVSFEAEHLLPIKAGDSIKITANLDSYTHGLAKGSAVAYLDKMLGGGGTMLKGSLYGSDPVCSEKISSCIKIAKEERRDV